MADTRVLRIVTAVTFIPAFPLCVAHGAISKNPLPAVGLVPLAFSAGVGILLASRQSAKQRQQPPPPEPEQLVDGGEEGLRQEPENTQSPWQTPDVSPPTRTQNRSLLVFAVDTVLAAALMVVLVLTWINSSQGRIRSATAVMLASYATMPLLLNFFIHLYLAVRELSRGLAIPGLTQYLAWQAVPPDCPDCGRRLRPAARPAMPWVDETSFPRPNLQNVKLKMKMPALPKVPPTWWGRPTAPKWRTPAWFKGPRHGYAPLFARDDVDEEEEDQEEASPVLYRDGSEVEGGPSASVEEPPETPIEPEVVEIVGKKSKRIGRISSLSPSP